MSDEIFNQIQAYEKRVFFFIEEHNWKKANEYAEKILDIQPENATAYLAKLLIEFHCSSITDLSKLKNSFEENINYKRIIQFGDKEIVDKINKELQKINKKKEQRRTEIETKVNIVKSKSISTLKVLLPICVCCVIIVIIFSSLIQPNIKYNKAVNLYENGEYEQAYDIFSELDNFKDSLAIRNEISKILKEKNYITYKELLIKIPQNYDITLRVDGGKLYIIGDFDCSINEFLTYVNAPSGYRLCTAGSYAKSNGTSSFLIEDYINVRTQYYFDGEWKKEVLDLLFVGYGDYSAKYIGKSGNVPYKYGNFATSLNEWRKNVRFDSETKIKGQYSPTGEQSGATTFELIIVRKAF